jgi:hypothetical protein
MDRGQKNRHGHNRPSFHRSVWIPALEVPLFRQPLAIAALVVLTACSSTPPQWHKEGVNGFDTANFESECKFQTGLAKIKGDQAQELIQHCMQAKGFRQR